MVYWYKYDTSRNLPSFCHMCCQTVAHLVALLLSALCFRQGMKSAAYYPRLGFVFAIPQLNHIIPVAGVKIQCLLWLLSSSSGWFLLSALSNVCKVSLI